MSDEQLPGMLRELEAAGADEAILVVRPITEASIRELGAMLPRAGAAVRISRWQVQR